MEFFTDRDLGAEIFPSALRKAGLTVHAHLDHFKPNADDTEWLPQVAARGWIILSNDQRMRRNPMERDAVMRSGATLIVLIGGDAPAEQLATNFINTLPALERFLAENPPPLIANLYRPNPKELIAQGRSGRVELKLSVDSWR